MADDSGRSPRHAEKDTGWCWMVLLGCHIALFLWEGLCKGLGVLLPTLKDQFNTETWPVGWVIGLMLASRGITGLMLGTLERRWTHRQIAVVCGVMASCGVIAASFTVNVVQFGIILVLLGAAYGPLLNCSWVILGHYFDRYYAMANGIACAGTSLGILVFAPMTQLLLTVYGWRGCMLLIGGLTLHLIVVGALFKPLHSYSDEYKPIPVESGNTTVEDGADATSGVAGDIGVGNRRGCVQTCDSESAKSGKLLAFIRAVDLDLFSSLSFVALVACFCNLCVVIIAWVVFTVPHVIVKGLEPNQASLVAVAGAVGILAGQLSYGPLVDRNIISDRALMYIGNFLMAIAFLLDPLLDQMLTLVIGNVIFGIGFGIALPLSFTMLRNLVGGDRMSGAVGWAEAMGSIARVLASFFTGWLYDQTGSYDISFIVMGMVPCLAILILFIEDVWVFYQARKVRC